MNYQHGAKNILVSKRNIILISLIITLAILAVSVVLSGTAFANGAVGTGGSGSGGGTGGGGYNSRNGFTWAAYDINGPGPSGGFRNGASWGSIRSVCQGVNAGSISIYVIRSANTNQFRGYNYNQDWSIGKIADGSVIDGGRATAIPSYWARAAFDALPAAAKAGYTFGGSNENVSWLCTGLGNNPNPQGRSLFSCSRGFQGWALDADNLSARLGVAVLVRRSGTTAWSTLSLTTANQPIPEPPFNRSNLAAFGVSGNRGFTVSLPSSYRDNLSYDWMIIAANATGTPGAPIANITLLDGAPFSSFRCPTPWDVGVNVSCDVDAGTITFSVSKTGTVPGNVTVTRSARLTNPVRALAPSSPVTLNNSQIPWSQTYDINPQPDLGQHVESSISISPGGAGTSNNTSNDSDSCSDGPRTAKPYLRVYGGDVVTGLDFQASDGTCSGIKDTTAGINAHSRNAGGNLVGAGSQFATSAAGQIVSFISAANHNGAASTNTRPFKDLMFSNTTSGNYGNDIGAYSGCLPDYSKLMDTTGGASSYTPGSTIAANSSGGIRRYHEGNLDITGDITLLPSQTIDADNGFVNIIIVKGGDIRIAPVVTQIDALLVAIPDDSGNGGTIDTCYLSTVATGGPCVNKLTINGSLVANKIEFDRLGGDLRDAGSDETPGSGSIAEVINYPAYLNFVFTGLVENSVPAASSPLNIGDYDSISEQPPIL